MLDNAEIKAKRLEGQLWYEIDDIQDLDIAESMFIPDEDARVSMLQGRFGGYWRYPQLMDFCYLVNPYFPPQKMIDEIKASFEKLVTQYPSGMRVNSLLAAKNFGVHSENILVGNGAAELIKSLMTDLKGKTGIVRPTFEEYGHRYREEDLVVYWPENDDFQYNVQDLIAFFIEKDIQNLVIINPDNPSGNYIQKTELLQLVKWTKDNGIKLLVDESFVDFADEENSSMIEQDILSNNAHLYIMKSISKSYGVPGLRLGVLASGDVETIDRMKKDVAIWNINSFAEFYMQIEEKYKKDYDVALDKFRVERTRYVEQLSKINGLRVIPSQANYIMAEVTTGMTAKELNRRLIVQYDILIKDLVAKMQKDGRQYVRLAVKTKEENDKLIAALKKELG
jgi:histidinol-phosphate/aromatic aminotransferase/cobyric acid decarboxylase-like protein